MSITTFAITAQTRTAAGKGASRRLRKSGQVPGILYGGQQTPLPITVNHNELLKHLEHEAFYSHVLSLTLDGVAESVVLKDLQRHPARPFILHLDFQRISADSRLRMHVPLHFINENLCPGLKMGGTATHNITEVEVSCLPKDLPEFITVDMANLEMGHTVHVNELQMPEGVELTHALDLRAPIVSIHGTRSASDNETDGAASAA